MRKDLRIGLGIGAVLLLVLIVALVVRSNGKNKQLAGDQADVEEIDGGPETGTTYRPDDVSTSPPVAQGQNDSVPPNGTTATPPKPPAGDVFAPDSPAEPPAGGVAGQRGSDWEMLLSGHAGSGGAAVSETPTAPRNNRGASAYLPPMAAASGGRRGDAGAGMLDSAPLVPPAAPPATANPPAGRTHVVRQGETFSSIARTAYGNSRYYRQIASANPGVNPNALKPGTTLVLPPLAGGDAPRTTRTGNRGPAAAIDRTREYQVVANDSLFKISEKLYGDGSRVDALYKLNRSAIGSDPRKLKLGMILKLPEAPSVAAGR